MDNGQYTDLLSEKVTPEVICKLLADSKYEHDVRDESIINVRNQNGVYVLFTSNLPWLRISKPATVRASRDITILQEAISHYDIGMVKCRIVNNKDGGYAIEAYIESIEPTYGHLKDTLNTYFFLLDKAFSDINNLYDKIAEKNEPKSHLPQATTLASKSYKLRKNGKILFWTYPVQIAIVALVFCCTALGIITGVAHYTGTIMTRSPMLVYSMLVGSTTILFATFISIYLYFKKNDKWIDWTIGIGIALTVYFVAGIILSITRGMTFSFFVFRHSLFMVDVNLAFLSFLIKYKDNLAIARDRVAKGEQMDYVRTVNPKSAKILFSIAVYALCIEVGFACAILIPQKVMAITGAVLVGIILFIIILVTDRNGYDEREECIEL